MNPELQQRLRSAFPELLADDSALLERFLRETVVRTLPPGQVVCQQGDSCGFLPLLLSGRARVFKSAESGREITLYRIDAGDSCVLTASCIMSDIPFPALAVSATEVEAVLIPAGSVRAWMGGAAAWRRYLFGLVARRLADVIAVVEEVAFRRLDARVAAWLLEHGAGDGVVRTTHQELAVDLGSSREVVSRILRDLENDGLIRRQRGEVVLLDTVRLKRLAAA